jgi:hypothetical protein
VENTDISHGDVRIKETDNTSALDRIKPSASQKSIDSSIVEKTRKNSKKGNSSGSHASSQKRRNFSRSQSVTAPKSTAPKAEATFSYSKQSSFSTMSDADLENWKLSMLDPTVSRSSETSQQEQPILTVAGSLTDSSNITVGFDVKEKEKE